MPDGRDAVNNEREVMPQFNVDFSKRDHLTIEVEADDKRSAICAARLKAPDGFKCEGVECLVDEDNADYFECLGCCEGCGQMLLEGDNYCFNSEDDCYTCGKCLESAPVCDGTEAEGCE